MEWEGTLDAMKPLMEMAKYQQDMAYLYVLFEYDHQPLGRQ